MNENKYIVDAFTKVGESTNLEVNNLKVGCITSKDNNFELDSEGNLTVKSIKASEISVALNLVYPVGSIYLTVNDKNPAVLFGGEWEQIKDRFLLGCGTSYQNGVTGGEETHLLTTKEMPKHTHANPVAITYGGNAGNYRSLFATNSQFWTMTDWNNQTSEQGESKAHNNMPPYLAVYMWKRIK